MLLRHCCWCGRGFSCYQTRCGGQILQFLLRSRERLQSIVMSMSVYEQFMSVCLSVREDISGSTRAIFTKFLVHVAYGRGSVLLRRRQCDEISREEAILGVFRGTVCYLGVTIPEEAILVRHVHNKPNTPMNCELDWSMQRRAQDRGRRLIASGGRVYYDRPRGEARLHNAGEV